MQVTISVRHGHLSESSQEKIRAKVEKFDRLLDRLSSIAVTADLENEAKPSITIQVSAEHKHDFVATERAPNLMEALDLAIDKMEQQLRRYKEKTQDHRHSGGSRSLSDANPADED